MPLCNMPGGPSATAAADVFGSSAAGVTGKSQSSAHHHAIPAELDRLLDLFRDISTTADLEAAWAAAAHLRDVADAIEAFANRRALELKAEGAL